MICRTFSCFFVSICWWLAGLSDARADVEALLARMTLREKIGQMTMITLNAVSKGQLPFTPKEPHEFDPERMRRVIVDCSVGTIFNIGHHAFSKSYWREIVTQLQAMAQKETRLKIPLLYGIDALHGMSFSTDATLIPHQGGLAATWNPALVEKAARITAYEARAAGIPWVFSPAAEPGRNPVHSRFYESFGEDPHLCEAMTTATVCGYTRADKAERVGATLKHFIGYSIPRTGRDRSGGDMAEHTLRDIFLGPYAAGIEAGARSVILNLSDLNGLPVHASRHWVQGVLKDELGFAGVVVSDWNAVDYLYFHHHVARDSREAIEQAVNAGIDLVMVPFDLTFVDHLESLVRQGRVPMARIDDAARRVLAFKAQLGLFEEQVLPESRYPLYGSQTFKHIARGAAAESLTLLKNTAKTLPLAKTARVLVTGFGADTMSALNGGWSYTWQGREADAYNPEGVTILDAIRAEAGQEDRVVFVETPLDRPQSVEAAVEAAKGVDAVVLCLGEEPYAEVFGNIDDLTMHPAMLDLARRLGESGKPVILVLTQGRPVVIGSIEKRMSAVLLAYLPGNEGGRAISDALYGRTNPSGRLPYTYPAGPSALFTYDHKYSEIYAHHVLYPFGWGMSYTDFSYENLLVTPDRLEPAGGLSVSVDVKNTGDRPGQEVVQLYVSDLYASVSPPVKRLKAFKKIALSPGEKQSVVFTLTARDLGFVDAANRLTAEAGEFAVSIGGLPSQPFVLTGSQEFRW